MKKKKKKRNKRKEKKEDRGSRGGGLREPMDSATPGERQKEDSASSRSS